MAKLNFKQIKSLKEGTWVTIISAVTVKGINEKGDKMDAVIRYHKEGDMMIAPVDNPENYDILMDLCDDDFDEEFSLCHPHKSKGGHICIETNELTYWYVNPKPKIRVKFLPDWFHDRITHRIGTLLYKSEKELVIQFKPLKGEDYLDAQFTYEKRPGNPEGVYTEINGEVAISISVL